MKTKKRFDIIREVFILFIFLTTFIPIKGEEFQQNFNVTDEKQFVLCLNDLYDQKVGEEIYWGGNTDYNYDLEKVDTFFISYPRELFSSPQLDKFLQISEGKYLQEVDTLKKCGNYNIYTVTEATTNSTYVFTLLNENRPGCMQIKDFISFKRPYNVFYTIAPPETKDYIDFVGIGAFVDIKEHLFDKRKKCYFQNIEELEGNFKIDKIYGIDNQGKFTLVNTKKAVFVFPDVDANSYYNNNKIPFDKLPYY